MAQEMAFEANVPSRDEKELARYTDFLVNEILPNGTALHLQSDTVPRKTEKKQQDGSKDHNGATETGGSVVDEKSEVVPSKRQGPEDDDGLGDGETNPRKKLRLDQAEPSSNGELPNGSEPAAPTAPDAQVSNKARKEQLLAGFPESDKTILHDIFGDATTSQILNLYASVVVHPERKPRDHPTVDSEIISEKAKRTEAHVAMRRIFTSKLETATVQDSPGVISIKAAPTKGPSGARGQPNGANQRGKLGWDELGGEYLHFTLYKENKDTMEVLYYIASQLKVHIKNFQFAGTKDRRGVTVQRVAIFRVHADRIARLNIAARGWRVGDFEYQKHGLELGELDGNEFLLTLRDCHFQGEEILPHEQRVSLANKVIGTAAESFTTCGFLNYYGSQRFGTFSTGTHVIGQKMLKGDLEGAVDSILTYSDDLLPENQDTSSSKKVPQDDINRADAIRSWRTTGQGNEAASKMPKRFQAESAIIQYLSKTDRKTNKPIQDKDWQGALMQISRNLRLMYVHAYQSFVWNTVAGKRWELHGDRPVEGDLVIVGEKGETSAPKDDVDEDGEPIFHPAADDSAPSAEDTFTRARPLSKEEAESGKYNIFDIVLPLPGYDVSYPANVVGKFYEEFMASEAGGEMDPHNMRRSWKDVSLSGSYRKVMARPGKGFGFEVKSYVSEEEQMVETDLERIQKRGRMDVDAGAADAKPEREIDGNQEADRKIAVVLRLQLGSSQYATMALRELTNGGAVNYRPDYSTR
ncbi:multisubstrate pseudouridine synthase 7 [Vermiconidia calcicola]|uniref:Multisubstrate pseudouridine synthase 7 n=1 Tax=Vermiconidia calcicola TaxID=1690605 RepID=A0ACC3NJ23_9PEZI|nr:multisubstrate pseudouridine synthase 7 [Vermiconidia calcicola]